MVMLETKTNDIKICPVCSKRFFLSCADWTYKVNGDSHQAKVYFCSWKCFRQYESTVPCKGKGGARLTLDPSKVISDYIDNEMSIAAIARKYGVTTPGIRELLRRNNIVQ